MSSSEGERRLPTYAGLSGPATPSAQLDGGLEFTAHAYISEGRASNTNRAYLSDWADFTAWCTAQKVQALAASTAIVVAYIANLATPVKDGGRRHIEYVVVEQPDRVQDGPTPTAPVPPPSQTQQELADRRNHRSARWDDVRSPTNDANRIDIDVQD